MNKLGWSGVLFGLLFIISALIPLGVYHFEGEADIVGTLWNLMLPTGWFDLAIGLMLLFHRKIGLRGKRLQYLVLLGGLTSLVLFYVQDVDVFLGLWRGVSGDFDVDGKWLGALLPFYVGLLSAVMGLFGMIRKGIFINQQGNEV